MADRDPHTSGEQYRDALEKTVPAAMFGPEGTTRELEATVDDSTAEPTAAAEECVGGLSATSLDRTPEQSGGDYLRRTATDPSGTHGDSRDPSVTLTSFGDSELLPSQLVGREREEGRRFEVEKQIGSGATSRVYAIHDRSLNRTIAVKFLRRARRGRRAVKDRFLHEARVTAMLEHPNVMPVHDIGLSETGEVYFTMKNVKGSSLGDAIRTAAAGSPTPEGFATFDDRVRSFLKVCDGLSYAHHRGFIHQDVKPDNIMLGEFGEVLLVDWGSALTRGDIEATSGKALYGTPAYMSPEQARRERADERSDVYCLGATFFHALTLRHPVWDTDPEVFWEKKRRGELDAVTEEERKRVPGALLDIALRAMHPDSARRYQSVNGFADELKRYQAGQAVQAHRETPVEMFMRWYSRNRRLFWSIAAGVVGVGLVGGVLFQEKLKELLTWRPVYECSFDNTSLEALSADWTAFGTENWRDMSEEPLVDGAVWSVDSGVLEGICRKQAHNITFRSRIAGDIRVEWRAISYNRDGDLNCFIAGTHRNNGYTFHVGGHGDGSRITLTKGGEGTGLENVQVREPFTRHRWYRFRMEKEGRHVRLWVNGEQVVDYVDIDAYAGPAHQQFGFEVNNGNRMAFDDVVVYHHPLPLKVSPLATPDQFSEHEHYREAFTLYEGIRDAYPNTEEAIEAEFRMARCLEELDSLDTALAWYDRFADANAGHELAAHALYRQGVVLQRQGKSAEADSLWEFLALTYRRSAIARTAVVAITQALKEPITRDALNTERMGGTRPPDTTLPAWIRTEAPRMYRLCEAVGLDPHRNAFIDAAGSYDVRRGVAIDSLKRWYPGYAHCFVRWHMGAYQYETVLDQYGEFQSEVHDALISMGSYLDIPVRFPGNRWYAADAYLRAGRFEEVLASYRDMPNVCAQAQLGLGRFGEVVSQYPGNRNACAVALLQLGRYREVLDSFPEQYAEARLASLVLGEYPRYRQYMAQDKIQWGQRLHNEEHNYDSARVVHSDWSLAGAPQHMYRLYETYSYAGLDSVALERFTNPGIRSTALSRLRKFDAARELFGSNASIGADVYVAMGLFDSVMQVYPDRLKQTIEALIYSAQYGELRRRFPRRRALMAESYLYEGAYEKVIEGYADQREYHVQALLRNSRFEQVLRDYPSSSGACFDALVGLGRGDEALERYAYRRDKCAHYLYEQGRYDEVAQSYPDCPQEERFALVELGRYGNLFGRHEFWYLRPDDRVDLYWYWVVRAAERGQTRLVDSLVAAPGPWARNVAMFIPAAFGQYLLRAILQGLAGDTVQYRQQLRRVAGEYPYLHFQLVRHMAQYLAGDIDAQAFMQQPYRRFAHENRMLLDAIRADVEGRTEDALAGYRRVPTGAPRPLMLYTYAALQGKSLQAFVDWRLRALGDAGTRRPSS